MISPEEHKAWFEKLKGQKTATYMVFEFHAKPVGLIYFTDIDLKNSKCRWGFYLGQEDLPRGTGTAMGFLGIEYVFEKLGIRKLCGEAFAFNRASIEFHKKLGFDQEGTFVKHILRNDIFEDVILLALFNQSWQEKKQTLEKIVFSQGEV